MIDIKFEKGKESFDVLPIKSTFLSYGFLHTVIKGLLYYQRVLYCNSAVGTGETNGM